MLTEWSTVNKYSGWYYFKLVKQKHKHNCIHDNKTEVIPNRVDLKNHNLKPFPPSLYLILFTIMLLTAVSIYITLIYVYLPVYIRTLCIILWTEFLCHSQKVQAVSDCHPWLITYQTNYFTLNFCLNPKKGDTVNVVWNVQYFLECNEQVFQKKKYHSRLTCKQWFL